jgi:hypothetical protein
VYFKNLHNVTYSGSLVTAIKTILTMNGIHAVILKVSQYYAHQKIYLSQTFATLNSDNVCLA